MKKYIMEKMELPDMLLADIDANGRVNGLIRIGGTAEERQEKIATLLKELYKFRKQIEEYVENQKLQTIIKAYREEIDALKGELEKNQQPDEEAIQIHHALQSAKEKK